MKLISMIDFVLEQTKLLREDLSDTLAIQYGKYLDRIEQYANFLKQPLTLGIFVPCDEKGNILRKPNYYSCFEDNSYLTQPDLINLENCERYQKAQQNVLFEGFDEIPVQGNGKGLLFQGEIVFKVEGLTHFNNLTFTKSALKQIGL